MPDDKYYQDKFAPIPNGKIEKITRLARDLAYGVLIEELWSASFNVTPIDIDSPLNYEYQTMQDYFRVIWNYKNPDFELLRLLGYLSKQPFAGRTVTWTVTQLSLTLLFEPVPLSIFISYRRKSSSALAMLIWSELKHLGLNPFLDIRDIDISDEWHGILKEKVQNSTIFIPIITHETFEDGAFTVDEVRWALEKKSVSDDQNFIKIISILHNNYTGKHLSESMFPELAEINPITILEDTASQFHSALNQLTSHLNLIR